MDLNRLVDTPPWDWPEGAGKILLRTLVDKHASDADRLTAAELAGEIVVINDDLAGALLTVVADRSEPEELRATTAISLGPVLELAYQDGFDDLDDSGLDAGSDAGVPITEHTFRSIQDLLRKLYLDDTNPQLVRRRILEAAGRAPDEWHAKAIRDAYASGDKDWMATAVFVMRWVRGFDRQILEALQSSDPEIHLQAVNAAGGWGLDAAWPQVLELVRNPSTPKALLVAAIEAVGNIHPREADKILADLLASGDAEIAEAAEEAIAMARAMTSEADGGEDDDDEGDEGDEGDEKAGSGWVN